MLTYKDSDEATVESNLTYDGTDMLMTSSSTNKPVVTLKNTHNGATGAYLKFVNDKGAAGADNDVCGTITFYGDDDNQDNIEFARIEGVVADASNGDECGALKLYVAENDGNNTVGLSLTGSTTDGEVDATIGAGSASVVTVPGHIDLAGDIDVDGTLEADAITIGGTTLLANDTNNRVTTATGSGTFNGEANLTFDGSTLQVTGALTVGVDDTGHDVQFFGASAGHYMLWDQSADEMILRMSSADAYAANTETGNLKLVNAGTDTDNQSVGIAFDVGAGNVGAIGKARIDAVHNGTGANSDLVFATQSSGTVTQRMRISSAGLGYLGDANAAGNYGNPNMTQGLTINQEANSDQILALKASDIAHGMTAITETDTYAKFDKIDGNGGCRFAGLGEDVAAISLDAFGTNENTTKSTSGVGTIMMLALKKSGTGFTSFGNDHNLVSIRNSNNITRWLLAGDGDVFYDGTTNASNWDDHDDVGLLDTFRNLTTANKAQDVFGEFVEKNAQILHDTGVITMNEDGHHFVSTKGLNALIIDTIRQEGQKWRKVVGEYQDKIAALEQRLLRLEA